MSATEEATIRHAISSPQSAQQMTEGVEVKLMSGQKFDRSQWPGLLKDLRSDDALTFEDAYHYVVNDVESVKDLLIEALEREEKGEIKGRFIELLGECRDEALLDLFKKALYSNDPDVFPWALTAIDMLSSKEAAQVTADFRKQHPEWEWNSPEKLGDRF